MSFRLIFSVAGNRTKEGRNLWEMSFKDSDDPPKVVGVGPLKINLPSTERMRVGWFTKEELEAHIKQFVIHLRSEGHTVEEVSTDGEVLFFVRTFAETDPQVTRMEIYVGEVEPEFPDGLSAVMYPDWGSFRDFLESDFRFAGKWDQVVIHKSPACPQKVIDDLKDWLEVNTTHNLI